MKQQRSTAILCAVILALLIFASPTALAASKEDHVSSFSTSDSVNYVYIPADTVLHVESCTRLDSGKTLYFFGGGGGRQAEGTGGERPQTAPEVIR